jgi:anti-anti-sigma factor
VPTLEHLTIEDGSHALVTLRGELDILGIGSLEPELERLAATPTVDVVTLDLRELEFMDSSGLRLVVVADQRMRESGRRLVVVRGPHPVMRVFEITRVAERLHWVERPEEAGR